ncbi:trypsin-like serine protease, partial [Vibrio artabrorum]|uniref:trypsin-like serine protease n=1 Tax=Vibrio artabrorum TaxID=446374 RepID=UPI00354B533A
MNNTPIVLALSLLSSSAFAITNGTNVDWAHDFDDVVKNNCTGLIVGGNQVLTAAHCTNLTGITFADGTVMDAVTPDVHPSYRYSSSGSEYDVSLWTLPHAAKVQNIHYFADLNTQTVAVGDSVKAYGFGGRHPLAYAEFIVNKLPSSSFSALKTAFDSNPISGDIIQGDSGGIWMHDDRIFALTSSGIVGWFSTSTDLSQAKDFLLEKINGWHYPTVLKGNGTQTIKIQSLHQNTVSDTAYVSGDVAITGGSCQTKSTIDAFETCTYQLEVNGSGQLHLTDHEVIDINPQDAPLVVTTPP